jgi:hypothetical protein
MITCPELEIFDPPAEGYIRLGSFHVTLDGV